VFHFPIPTLPPIRPSLPTCAWADGVFNPDDLDRINAIALTMPSKRVGVGQDLHYEPRVNRSTVRWLKPSESTEWIYMRMTHAIARLNATHYQFDITGLDEELYHVTYDGSDEGHYDWHHDSHADNGFTRKLSVTLQLSEPGNYDGGDLEINGGGRPEAMARVRGRMLMFPSYEVHRVTPVTRGIRSALVAWIVGPPFR
jgi:PKHD-type hydroxylase